MSLGTNRIVGSSADVEPVRFRCSSSEQTSSSCRGCKFCLRNCNPSLLPLLEPAHLRNIADLPLDPSDSYSPSPERGRAAAKTGTGDDDMAAPGTGEGVIAVPGTADSHIAAVGSGDGKTAVPSFHEPPLPESQSQKSSGLKPEGPPPLERSRSNRGQVLTLVPRNKVRTHSRRHDGGAHKSDSRRHRPEERHRRDGDQDRSKKDFEEDCSSNERSVNEQDCRHRDRKDRDARQRGRVGHEDRDRERKGRNGERNSPRHDDRGRDRDGRRPEERERARQNQSADGRVCERDYRKLVKRDRERPGPKHDDRDQDRHGRRPDKRQRERPGQKHHERDRDRGSRRPEERDRDQQQGRRVEDRDRDREGQRHHDRVPESDGHRHDDRDCERDGRKHDDRRQERDNYKSEGMDRSGGRPERSGSRDHQSSRQCVLPPSMDRLDVTDMQHASSQWRFWPCQMPKWYFEFFTIDGHPRLIESNKEQSHTNSSRSLLPPTTIKGLAQWRVHVESQRSRGRPADFSRRA
jgi:hypothetical protein